MRFHNCNILQITTECFLVLSMNLKSQPFKTFLPCLIFAFCSKNCLKNSNCWITKNTIPPLLLFECAKGRVTCLCGVNNNDLQQHLILMFDFERPTWTVLSHVPGKNVFVKATVFLSTKFFIRNFKADPSLWWLSIIFCLQLFFAEKWFSHFFEDKSAWCTFNSCIINHSLLCQNRLLIFKNHAWIWMFWFVFILSLTRKFLNFTKRH